MSGDEAFDDYRDRLLKSCDPPPAWEWGRLRAAFEAGHAVATERAAKVVEGKMLSPHADWVSCPCDMCDQHPTGLKVAAAIRGEG